MSSKESIFILKNLDCANCAAKMERKIKELPGVKKVTISYVTKQMRLSAGDIENLLPSIREICTAIESGVEVIPQISSSDSNQFEIHDNNQHVDKKITKQEHKYSLKGLPEIIIGAVLFIVSEFLDIVPEHLRIYLLVLAYILLGWRIVYAAVRNILKGQIFDENFLMTIATLGAFAIKQYEEAVGVMLFYKVGEYFEERAVEKSRGQIMEAVDLRPETVNLVQGDEVKVVAAATAQVNDILLVRVGDRIPLDGVILEGESLIDTSPVTGEPVPVRRRLGEEVISGCINTSGMLKIKVEKVLAESMVTKILDSVENAAASKPQIDRFITRFARIYTPFVVAVAIATAIIPSLITGNWDYWIYTALTFLVISCPCALVLSVPLTFFSGIGAGSKYGILFKGGATMEVLKKVGAVVMDKTGTITKGNFVLQKIVTMQGIDEEKLLEIAAGVELSSTHPIANSVVNAAKEKGLQLIRPKNFEEIAGEGIVAQTDMGELLCGNKKLLQRYNVFYNDQSDDYGTEVLVAAAGKYLGKLIISDTPKADAIEAIAAIKKMGLATVMLTGDNAVSAKEIAQEVGVDEVKGDLLPQDKFGELNRLRSKYGSVMFVGDGINDAPVLAGADVGAAMGSGADAALEAADVVFMNSEMQSIPRALKIAQVTGKIAWQNVIFALAVKIIIMGAGLAGFASMWAAVFADTGVAMLCVLNSIRILYQKL